MSQRINKKRVRTLANNLSMTTPEEMRVVVEQLLEDKAVLPEQLHGIFYRALRVTEEGYKISYKEMWVQLSGVHRSGHGAVSSNYIATIKNLREHFNWSLKDAKRSVDMVCGNDGTVLRDFRADSRGHAMATVDASSAEFRQLCANMTKYSVLVYAVPARHAE